CWRVSGRCWSACWRLRKPLPESAEQAVGEMGEVRHGNRRRGKNPERPAVPIDPGGMHADAERAAHVAVDIVTTVQRLLRLDPRTRAGLAEDLPGWLARPGLQRRQREIEVLAETGALDVGIAVGDGGDDEPALQALERGNHVLEALDLVAGGPEGGEGSFRMALRIAGAA